jgi:hypothetical protein
VKLNLSRLQKKLAEAAFFLGKLMKQEQRLTGHREPFDYYLSAFLSAGMSFRDGFQIGQDRPRNTAIKTWRAQWENNLTSEEKSLYDFMQKDRVDEVHYSGSSRDVGEEGVPLPSGIYRTPHDGIFGSDDLPTAGPNLVFRPTYSFTINGTDRKVTDACRAYLALLQRMMADFEAANP